MFLYWCVCFTCLALPNCTPSWLYLQDYTGMHSQQNIKFCRFCVEFVRFNLKVMYSYHTYNCVLVNSISYIISQAIYNNRICTEFFIFMSTCTLVAVVKLKDTWKFCMSVLADVLFRCEKWEDATIQIYMELNFVVFWCVTLFTLVDRYQPFQCAPSTQTYIWWVATFVFTMPYCAIYHKSYLDVHCCENQHSCWVMWLVSPFQIRSVQCIIRHQVLIRRGLSWIHLYLFNRWGRMVWLWRGVRWVFNSMWDFLTIRWAII
jgi:hypothetical protein